MPNLDLHTICNCESAPTNDLPLYIYLHTNVFIWHHLYTFAIIITLQSHNCLVCVTVTGPLPQMFLAGWTMSTSLQYLLLLRVMTDCFLEQNRKFGCVLYRPMIDLHLLCCHYRRCLFSYKEVHFLITRQRLKNRIVSVKLRSPSARRLTFVFAKIICHKN